MPSPDEVEVNEYYAKGDDRISWLVSQMKAFIERQEGDVYIDPRDLQRYCADVSGHSAKDQVENDFARALELLEAQQYIEDASVWRDGTLKVGSKFQSRLENKQEEEAAKTSVGLGEFESREEQRNSIDADDARRGWMKKMCIIALYKGGQHTVERQQLYQWCGSKCGIANPSEDSDLDDVLKELEREDYIMNYWGGGEGRDRVQLQGKLQKEAEQLLAEESDVDSYKRNH